MLAHWLAAAARCCCCLLCSGIFTVDSPLLLLPVVELRQCAALTAGSPLVMPGRHVGLLCYVLDGKFCCRPAASRRAMRLKRCIYRVLFHGLYDA